MHKLFRMKAYEAECGPHFDEKYARKAVSNMLNEDGSRGPHWSIEDTTTLANQYGVRIDSKFNKYDWYVALNMIYSDFYRFVITISGTANVKHFVELAKAWLNDKDIPEGKMWYYFMYVMCDHIREEEDELYEKNAYRYEEDDDEDEIRFRRSGRAGMRGMSRRHTYEREYDPYSYDEDDRRDVYSRGRSIRYVR